jgi:hypothetical protein
MTALLVVEGTWAAEPWGLCGYVIEILNDTIRPERIPYPGRFGDGVSYSQSASIATENLRRRIDTLKEPYVLLGYSQGAGAVGDVASEYRDDPNLIAAFNIADPKRSPEDRLIGQYAPGCGIISSRYIGPKALQFASPDDFIASNTNPFLSNVAAYTLDRSRVKDLEWFKSFKKCSANRQTGGDVRAAIKTVKTYIKTQVHTNYHLYEVEPGITATQWIARAINQMG